MAEKMVQVTQNLLSYHTDFAKCLGIQHNRNYYVYDLQRMSSLSSKMTISSHSKSDPISLIQIHNVPDRMANLIIARRNEYELKNINRFH